MDAPPVDLTDGTFAGTGGCTLSYRRWRPGADAPQAQATVVVAHGLGEHAGRYDHVGRHLAGHGYDVWALDHRGHGRSAGRRVYVDAFEQFVDDLDAFRALAVAEGPGRPAVLLGHSMGGAIATAHAIDHPGAFDLLVLTGPLLQPGRSVPRALVAASRLISAVAPKLVVMRLDPELVSRDPAVVAAYDADPLVHRGKISARLGEQLLTRAARFPDELTRITVPVLLVHGTEDGLVPIAGSRELVGRFGSSDVTFVEEEGLFHEVLNEPERERVLATITAWLDERVAAATPSGPTERSGAGA